MSTITWPGLLARLVAGNDLSAADSRWAMDHIMDARATDAQIAGLILGLRAKGETAAEVTGLAAGMLDHALALHVPGPTLDVVGTGGDGAHTVNISTMAAVVCAAAGARVVKHGNRAASSACGSADVLAALGVAVDLGPAQVGESVATVGIGFCFAPTFHPAMRHVAGVRRELGIPTVFNILGPLANPARPSAQLVGCADARFAPIMADVLAERGTAALLVRGRDGLDEVTTYGQTEVWDTTGSAIGPDGSRRVRRDLIDPGRFEIPVPAPNALRGGDASANARIARELFAEARSLPAVRDAVALNAAAALVAWDRVNTPTPTSATQVGSGTTSTRPNGSAEPVEPSLRGRMESTLPRAYQALDSGAAGELLERWARLSQRQAGSRS